MADRMSRRSFVKATSVGAVAVALGDQVLQPGAVAAHSLPQHFAAPVGQMPALDPQMQAVIDELVAFEAPKLTDLTPFNARQGNALGNAVQAVLTKQGKPPTEPVVNVAHRLIPGGAGQQLLLRIYQPGGDGPFPALVYFHGGGWVIANLDTYDSSCRALTNAANCSVISVAYRQAPEFRFPAAPMDAFAAYQWVLKNAASIRVDPSRVAVGGESAGGNLATVTALMARDRGAQMPVHQLLVYPIANYAFDTPSYQAFTEAMPLNTPMMQWFFRYYLRNAADGANPYVSPLRANVHGLPPATVITAEVDPLRDEGEAYAMRLKEAGINTTLTRYTGVTHEFFGMPAIVDKAKQAVGEAAGALKTAFGM
jgi:acetyl esterase